MRTSLIAILALVSLACVTDLEGQDTGAYTTGDTGEDSTTSESGEDSETSDSGPDEVENDNGDSSCIDSSECEDDELCIDNKCVLLDPLASCPGIELDSNWLAGPNGLIDAIDVADIDADGVDEIVGWIRNTGVGVFDEGAWTVTEHIVPVVDVAEIEIAVVDADGQGDLDLLLNVDELLRVGYADGNSGFAFGPTTTLEWLSELQHVEFEPGIPSALGIGSVEGPGIIELEPELALAPFYIGPGSWIQMLTATVVGAPSVLLSDYSCRFRVLRHLGDGSFATTAFSVQPQNMFCEWQPADLDGEGNHELVLVERLGLDLDTTVLSRFEIGENEGMAWFGPRLAVELDGLHSLIAAADFDSDGRDELLLTGAGEELLVWSERGTTLDCVSSVPALDHFAQLRVGQLDDDPGEELVLLMANGAIQVVEAL